MSNKDSSTKKQAPKVSLEFAQRIAQKDKPVNLTVLVKPSKPSSTLTENGGNSN